MGGIPFWSERLRIKVTRQRLRWHDDAIHGALAFFLNGRSEWPPARAFKAADQSKLYAAVVKSHGVSYWAERFGFVLDPRSRLYWTDKRIEASLSALIAELGRFPSKRVLLARGERTLYDALGRSGGVASWQRRMRKIPPRPEYHPHAAAEPNWLAPLLRS